MLSRLGRVIGGALAALLVASALKVGIFDSALFGLAPDAQTTSALSQAFVFIFLYALPLAALSIAATELFRLRHVATHVALGVLVAATAAFFLVRYEPMTSLVFARGGVRALGIVLLGLAGALVHWSIAGRFAGWRGAETEKQAAIAAEAFAAAGDSARKAACEPCAYTWSAIGLALFALLGWVLIDGVGLRASLLNGTQTTGRVALEEGGFYWASFRVDDDHGVIEGLAPDEKEKAAAADAVREALRAVVGVPGVLTVVDNEAVAKLPPAQPPPEAGKSSAYGEAVVARNDESSKRSAASAALLDRNGEQTAAVAFRFVLASASPTVINAALLAAGASNRAATRRLMRSNSLLFASNPIEVPSCDQDVESVLDGARIDFGIKQFEISDAVAAELQKATAKAQQCALRPRPMLQPGSDAASTFNPSLVAIDFKVHDVGAAWLILPAGGTPSANSDNLSERQALRSAEIRPAAAGPAIEEKSSAAEPVAERCESNLAAITAKSIIHFSSASAFVSQESSEVIKTLAAAINHCGSVVVTIEGHTDKIGTPEQNLGLSVARANSVREALVNAGADPARLAPLGLAARRPLDMADTPQALAMNRRIEFRVSGSLASAAGVAP